MTLKNGREYPDSTPIEVPVRFRQSESTDARMRRLISEAMSRYAVSNGMESIDEANDFDIEGDDPDETFTEHEVLAMSLEHPGGAGADATYDAGYRAGKAPRGESSPARGAVGDEAEAQEDRPPGAARRAGGRPGQPGEDDSPGSEGDPPPSRGASPRR